MSLPKARHSGKITFVTGTDTGVGKTVLTGLLLHSLRQTGVHALAMKPFCSGSRDDARLFAALQDNELDIDGVNPFFFGEPVAPLVAARKQAKMIGLKQVVEAIHRIQRRCERLLVEGVGGVLVPLGERWFVRDLISKLGCEVVVVSRNRLGTINHTMLATEALERASIRRIKVVLMDGQKQDCSSGSNHLMLSELLRPIPVLKIQFLGPEASRPTGLKKNLKKTHKTLARILA